MSGRDGFTLVELLVSITIFSFGVLGSVALLETGYRWEGRAELTTQMTVAAEMKIEELRALAGTELADTVQLALGGGLESDVAAHWDSVAIDGRVFGRRWQVEAGPSGTRLVTVQVRAVNPQHVAQVELWTYVIHD